MTDDTPITREARFVECFTAHPDGNPSDEFIRGWNAALNEAWRRYLTLLGRNPMSSDDTPIARETPLPCPFCGEIPDDVEANQSGKWGFVICCCNGPEVRTNYKPEEIWREDAIKEWNRRSLPAAATLLRAHGWTVEAPKCETCGGDGITGPFPLPDCPTCNGTGGRP